MKKIILPLLISTTALAWGPEGHQITGGIAERHLTPATLAKVRSLIGNESLKQLSTWADEIKSDPRNGYTKPWHFVNIPNGQTYQQSQKDPAGDVVEAIGRFTAVLNDPRLPQDKRRDALAFVVHFLGDVHQPFHVGLTEDRGGNSIRATWQGRDTNLHAVWDTSMIRDQGQSVDAIIARLDQIPAAQVPAISSVPLSAWIAEDIALRPLIYSYRLGQETSYERAVTQAMDQQLLRGGLRLAAWLNTNLK